MIMFSSSAVLITGMKICVICPSKSIRRVHSFMVSLNNSNQLANVDVSIHPLLKKL